MNKNLSIFNYEGNDVTFYNKDGMLFINATEMARPFGNQKRPAFWLRTSAAIDYINAVSDVQKCTSADLQRVTKGGENTEQGTWLQEDVALAFAQWLSPKFHVWCNQKIKELLSRGVATVATVAPAAPEPRFQIPQSFSEALMLAAKQAQQIEADSKVITEQKRQIDKQHQLIEKMEEESAYCQAILQSKSLVTTTSIAQDYGYSAVGFNQILNHHGIQYKQGTQWIITCKYKDKGYVQSETIRIQGKNGRSSVVVHTKWTQKGRMFLYQFLKKHNLLPVLERDNN